MFSRTHVFPFFSVFFCWHVDFNFLLASCLTFLRIAHWFACFLANLVLHVFHCFDATSTFVCYTFPTDIDITLKDFSSSLQTTDEAHQGETSSLHSGYFWNIGLFTLFWIQ